MISIIIWKKEDWESIYKWKLEDIFKNCIISKMKDTKEETKWLVIY